MSSQEKQALHIKKAVKAMFTSPWFSNKKQFVPVPKKTPEEIEQFKLEEKKKNDERKALKEAREKEAMKELEERQESSRGKKKICFIYSLDDCFPPIYFFVNLISILCSCFVDVGVINFSCYYKICLFTLKVVSL